MLHQVSGAPGEVGGGWVVAGLIAWPVSGLIRAAAGSATVGNGVVAWPERRCFWRGGCDEGASRCRRCAALDVAAGGQPVGTAVVVSAGRQADIV